MGLNVDGVFRGRGSKGGYHQALKVDEQAEQRLRLARDKIRRKLRDALRSWSDVVSPEKLFEIHEGFEPPSSLSPKFRMQGSFAYHTHISPEKAPPQQVDLDDGMFLPVSFLQSDGASHPALMSAGYFDAVEAVLQPLCTREGWELNTDKSSCVRVQLSQDEHMDVALYAVPDADFFKLNEALDEAVKAESPDFELNEAVYRDLASDRIMLAHREEGWKESDPRKLESWFQDAVNTHGAQLRRQCRYLKGWRSYQWESCGLASIALMSSVVTTYEEDGGEFSENRDDLALLAVASRLPMVLGNRVKNPVVEGAYLDEGWSPEDRQAYIRAAQSLHWGLAFAMKEAEDPEEALGRLAGLFGERIPKDGALVSEDGTGVLDHGLLNDPAEHEAVKLGGSNRHA